MSLFNGSYGTMYYVTDMAKSIAFYKEVYGLKTRFESNEWTEFDIGENAVLCLHGTDSKHPPLSKGGVLITKVKNIKTLVPELEKKGVEFLRGVTEVHPGAFCADYKDPSGNVLSLYEDTNNR